MSDTPRTDALAEAHLTIDEGIEQTLALARTLERELGSSTGILDDARTVLRGFDEGVFIRDVAHDAESGWAVKLLPFMAALGRLASHLKHPAVSLGDKP